MTMNNVLSRFALPGKVAIITGGGSGIGRATAHHFTSTGAIVCIIDRNADKGEELVEAISKAGGKAASFAVDVIDETAMTATFETIAERFGGIDVLVNNAGMAIRSPALEMSVEDWNEVVGVNMTAMFVAARLAARHMKSAGKGGAIVNTASIMGLSGGLYPNIAYQSTKGGVVNMTRALALEWAPLGIRVNAVAPTFVRTSFIQPVLDDPERMATIEAATPLGRIAEPEEVADAILFLASPAATMITGVILPVDGGFLAR
jgi:NAD(P)-dependent dehydrogenase (short-subunit alcohol dehydrogenase family)